MVPHILHSSNIVTPVDFLDPQESTYAVTETLGMATVADQFCGWYVNMDANFYDFEELKVSVKIPESEISQSNKQEQIFQSPFVPSDVENFDTRDENSGGSTNDSLDSLRRFVRAMDAKVEEVCAKVSILLAKIKRDNDMMPVKEIFFDPYLGLCYKCTTDPGDDFYELSSSDDTSLNLFASEQEEEFLSLDNYIVEANEDREMGNFVWIPQVPYMGDLYFNPVNVVGFSVVSPSNRRFSGLNSGSENTGKFQQGIYARLRHKDHFYPTNKSSQFTIFVEQIAQVLRVLMRNISLHPRHGD